MSRDFDQFLYASIGDDARGMPVTVLSALARLDVDPWEEAVSLARLSLDSAAKRLAATLAALPNRPAMNADPASIAERLVALLHGAPVASQVQSPAAPARGTVANRSKRVSLALYSLLALIVMLIGQWVFGAAHLRSPAAESRAPAVSSNLASPIAR